MPSYKPPPIVRKVKEKKKWTKSAGIKHLPRVQASDGNWKHVYAEICEPKSRNKFRWFADGTIEKNGAVWKTNKFSFTMKSFKALVEEQA